MPEPLKIKTASDSSAYAAAVKKLNTVDPTMKNLITIHGPCVLPQRGETPFQALAESIVYQQLQGKAAASIFQRLMNLVNGQLTPESVSASPPESLRGVGLSTAKAASISDLARHYSEGLVTDSIVTQSDVEIIERLTAVRGIGPWTAQMFLIFYLHRLDVWPAGDYGVRKGYSLAYGLSDLPSIREMPQLGEPYQPYRSVAAWYLWRVLDK